MRSHKAIAIVLAGLCLAGCAPSTDDAMQNCVVETFDREYARDPEGDYTQAAFDLCNAMLEGDPERFVEKFGD
jgi:hypothetical protein